MVKAQKAFGPALKSNTNPAFKSKYADLSACVEAVIDALNDNGIAMMQKTIPCESGVTVETVFIHESGETMSSGPLHVPASKQDAQGYGSALTYARRYSLMAACGIAPEDDDGNSASRRQPPVQAPQQVDTASALNEISKLDNPADIKKVWAKWAAVCKVANATGAHAAIKAAVVARGEELKVAA